MGPVDIGVAVRADHQEPNTLEAGCLTDGVHQHQQGRLGRPVDVVDDENQPGLLSRCDDPRCDRLEQPVLFGTRIGRHRLLEPRTPCREVGYQACQLTGQSTQRQFGGVLGLPVERLHEGLIRDLELVVATPEQHDGAGLASFHGDLVGGAGLADSRLADE